MPEIDSHTEETFMFIFAMKRIVVFALAIFAVFTSTAGKGQPDSYEAYDFPIIKAEK